MSMQTPKPPYLGVAYYPEDWPDEMMNEDISKMAEMGINLARIGEFAWRRMEPREGEYDFSYFHRVVEKLGAAGIAVILGTPTATPPVWFLKKYPEAAAEKRDGRKASHGGRRHICSNHPAFVEKSVEIARRMAMEFGRDPRVVGWQIDNEIYAGDGGCFCENCLRRFHEWLEARYGTVDALNEAWDLNIFSQWYDSFDDVPAPRDGWHNPHLIQAWDMFQNESHIRFVHAQADAMRPYTGLPIGTDTMPVYAMDYRKLAEKLDVMQFNHYNSADNLYHAALHMDYLRTLKERPFWNTETATCWNGGTDIWMSVQPDGFCRANSWMPLALGGEANCYWLWRTHWGGHELMHGSVLDASGRPMHIAEEVKQTAKEFTLAADMVENCPVETQVGLHFDSVNWNMFRAQSVVRDLKYGQTVIERFYKPMIDLALRPDVIDSGAALEKYKLIVSPLMMTLEKDGLGERMAQWVRDGGVWVAGPITDVRDIHGARYQDRPMGILEEVSGAAWKYAVPDAKGQIRARWMDGAPLEGSGWFELWEGGEPLAAVTAGHSALVGKSLVTRCKVGKGTLYLLGTLPSARDMERLLKLALEDAGLPYGGLTGEALVSPRRGGGLMLVEYAGKEADYRIEETMQDMLTGETFEGHVPLSAYQVRVLRRR